jgi:tetratricopeptide (TPR) repeat protein
MRKNSSKVLRSPSAIVARVKARPPSNGKTKASSDSPTQSNNGCARRKTRGRNTRKQSALRDDPCLNRLLQHAIDLKNEEKFEEAADAFTQIVTQYPDCAPANGLLGAILHLELKRSREAIPYCRKATQLAPKSQMASLGLFHSLWATDQIYEALDEIKRYQLLTNWSCQDYLEIVDEIKEKWLDPPTPKKKANRKR